MTKEDYNLMFKDGLFWWVLLFSIVLFIALATPVTMLVILSFILVSIIYLMVLAARKLYKLYQTKGHWTGIQ